MRHGESRVSCIAEQAAFDRVRYANCWEDADILVEALSCSAPGGNVLSVASAGDNSLSLLTLKPNCVVAFDISRPQLACLELRIAGFRRLAYEELLGFLGVENEIEPRCQVYRVLRGELSPGAREFWDCHSREIDAGIIHQGKFERYFQLFRRWILPLVHRRRTIESLSTQRGGESGRRFYREQWDNWRWRLLFHLFFGRAVLGKLGRDPAFFNQVEGSVAGRLLARAHYGLTELPVVDNPYLDYIINGNFCKQRPHYLLPENFQVIRDGLDAIIPVQCALGDDELSRYGRYSAFNLSDIFEYMDLPTCRVSARCLADMAEPGATAAYWNMLVPRNLAQIAGANFADRPLPAHALHERDKAFFYSAFCLSERACA